jgi:class 3 adenylate cyclase
LRLFTRIVAALLFAAAMLAVYASAVGRFLEREYGLTTLYSLRGDVVVPDEALIIGLDNASVAWLTRGVIHDDLPASLDGCLTSEVKQTLLGAANINHIPRPVHACLVEALAGRGARVIAFDINFNKDRLGDVPLAKAIAAAESVLLFVRYNVDADGLIHVSNPTDLLARAAKDTMAFRVDSNRGAMATAYKTRFPVSVGEDLIAMPDRVWMEFTGKPRPEVSDDFQPFWLYGPPRTVPTLSLKDVFDPSGPGLPEEMRNVAVFIGSSDPTDASIDDHFPIPTSGRGNDLVGGVELAATAFLNRLHGEPLNRPSHWIEVVLVFGMAFFGALVALTQTGWRLWAILASGFLGYSVISALAFAQAKMWMPVAVPVFATVPIICLAALAVRYLFARALVTRLAPKQVAQQLLDSTVADRSDIRTEQATIMFTDLVSSTAMSEMLSEIAYSEAINIYYDLATEVIEAHGGMVVEFMGDGILSIFSQSVTGSDHARRACDAACALVDALMAANSEAKDHPDLCIRVGINSGLTATGDIGARRRYNFKALGEVVNVAARLEEMGKTVGKGADHIVLVSEATRTAAELPEAKVIALGPLALRGHRSKVNTYLIR